MRNDAVATAHNILTHDLLYRLGLAADLVSVICYVGVTAFLYALLRPAGRSASLLAAFFSLAGCTIMAGNLINHIAPLILLGNAPYLTPFNAAQLQALAMLFLKLQSYGYVIATMFFGLYCFTLGWLIVHARFMPRILGVLLAIGGLCYLANGAAAFLAPAVATQISAYLTAPPGIAEIALALWLSVVGVNSAKWKAQAGQPGG